MKQVVISKTRNIKEVIYPPMEQHKIYISAPTAVFSTLIFTVFNIPNKSFVKLFYRI